MGVRPMIQQLINSGAYPSNSAGRTPPGHQAAVLERFVESGLQLARAPSVGRSISLARRYRKPWRAIVRWFVIRAQNEVAGRLEVQIETTQYSLCTSSGYRRIEISTVLHGSAGQVSGGWVAGVLVQRLAP